MVDQKAIADAIGDVIAQRDALAAELDLERHDFVADPKDTRWCERCHRGKGSVMHRTSAVVLAALKPVSS